MDVLKLETSLQMITRGHQDIIKSENSLLFEESIRNPQFAIYNRWFLLAVLLHLIGIFVYVKIPPNQPMSANETFAFAWPARSTEGKQLSLWAQANDPALFSKIAPSTQTLLQLDPISYSASYDSQTPDILTINIPPFQPQQTAPRPITPSFPNAFSPYRFAFPSHTQILIHGEFELAKQPDLTKLNGLIDGSTIPYFVTFQVASDPKGQPRYLFLQHSSSLPTLDKAARRFLLKTQFTPSTNDELRWGEVTLQWGLDVFRNPNETQ